MKQTRTVISFLSIILLLVLLVTACGRRDLPPQGAAPVGEGQVDTPKAAATPLSATFGQATLEPQEEAETEEAETEAEVEAAEAAEPAQDFSRGQTIYTNRQCGDCHGANGEGVADRGGALAGNELSEAEFTDILRTGGNGELGNDHLYGTQAVSPSGMTALYEYVKSFDE